LTRQGGSGGGSSSGIRGNGGGEISVWRRRNKWRENKASAIVSCSSACSLAAALKCGMASTGVGRRSGGGAGKRINGARKRNNQASTAAS